MAETFSFLKILWFLVRGVVGTNFSLRDQTNQDPSRWCGSEGNDFIFQRFIASVRRSVAERFRLLKQRQATLADKGGIASFVQ